MTLDTCTLKPPPYCGDDLEVYNNVSYYLRVAKWKVMARWYIRSWLLLTPSMTFAMNIFWMIWQLQTAYFHPDVQRRYDLAMRSQLMCSAAGELDLHSVCSDRLLWAARPYWVNVVDVWRINMSNDIASVLHAIASVFIWIGSCFMSIEHEVVNFCAVGTVCRLHVEHIIHTLSDSTASFIWWAGILLVIFIITLILPVREIMLSSHKKDEYMYQMMREVATKYTPLSLPDNDTMSDSDKTRTRVRETVSGILTRRPVKSLTCDV